MIRLHNTLTRRIEEFKPLKDNVVKLYSCGPTVYSSYHVGNLRNAVFNDTLRRTLEVNGFDVRHVMNITDVGHLTGDGDEGEDKLEKGARAEKKSVWEIAGYYTKLFKDDVDSLNIIPPNGYRGSQDNYARATDFIDQQIDMVDRLLERGFAYQAPEAIYFDVSRLDDYGELTGQSLVQKMTAARPEIVTDSNKRQPQDFAVWFFTTGHFAGHDMRWPSPWGEGFPGWHLECSAIIHATLGDPIDIHTGGVDLIGTHHINEAAQTEAAFGHKLAKYWAHNEHVLIDGQRMGKSLGNIYSLKDVKKRRFNPLALRLLFLQSHYRSQMNFTWTALEAAQAGLKNLYAWADLIHQPSAASRLDNTGSEKLINQIQRALSNDLDTPGAMARLNQAANYGAPSAFLLKRLEAMLGLGLSGRPDISAKLKKLIGERETARTNQDWAAADSIRKSLSKVGLDLNDTDRGPVWSRQNL